MPLNRGRQASPQARQASISTSVSPLVTKRWPIPASSSRSSR